MSGPSAHLTWKELACHDAVQTPYPTPWRQNRAKRLGKAFEGLRAHCGGIPLAIHSGYRTPVWNRKKGGKSRSQHPAGRAVDIGRPKGWTLKKFHAAAYAYAKLDRTVGGIGLYRWGIHFDVRTRPATGRMASWNQVPAGTKVHDV